MFHCVLVLMACAAVEEKPATTRVEGTLVVPADAYSFKGRLLEIRLYEYDPRIADKAADLVEKVEIKDFAHEKGKPTKKTFEVGKKATRAANRSYYLTLFILENGNRTHIGEAKHAQGLIKVLTDGNPDKVEITFREIRRP